MSTGDVFALGCHKFVCGMSGYKDDLWVKLTVLLRFEKVQVLIGIVLKLTGVRLGPVDSYESAYLNS